MQPVDDVDFGERLVGALPQLVPRLLERHRVRAIVPRLEACKRTEQAARDADVRRLEADVVVVERPRAVALLALAIRQPADRQEVGTLEKPDALAQIETLASIELRGNVEETGVGETLIHRVIGSGNRVIELPDYQITR